MSLRARIALLVGLAVGLAVALSSVAAYVTVRHEVQEARDVSLLRRAGAAAASSLANTGVLARVPTEALGAADVRIAIVDSDGGALSAFGAASAPPLGMAELAVARGLSGVSLRDADLGGQHYRVVAVPTGQSSALVLAQSTADTQHELGRLGLVLLLVGGGGIVLSVSAGVAVARAGLRPVDQLTAAAEHVARTDRLEPIPVRGTDELARLTTSFNAMLAALARSRGRQQQLVADAGHELRTPLTSLRTNVDLLAQALRSAGQPGQPSLDPAERDALLADARAQVGELSALVGDLVELARDEPPPAVTEPVELPDVVARAVERVRRRALTLRWAVRTEPWQVHGDATALERAVTNLLDNAAKWSPPDGTVTVTLVDGLLEVADQGPGIAAADLPHIFERFYRSAEGRNQPGSGLGLAIVRQVVERHGGTVTAGSGPTGGALFRLRLPGHPDSPEALNDHSASSQPERETWSHG
ncbi:MAG TPA: HAMP domain-containing sensor histidine kinase [Mycobacteriales bacterium]|nr:HAMP domain-containing sensor histidine kinase [Mycobacteriales bacterium]